MNFKTDKNKRKKKIQRFVGLGTFLKPEIVCSDIGVVRYSRHFIEWYNEELNIVWRWTWYQLYYSESGGALILSTKLYYHTKLIQYLIMSCLEPKSIQFNTIYIWSCSKYQFSHYYSSCICIYNGLLCQLPWRMRGHHCYLWYIKCLEKKPGIRHCIF